jgi:hypothetical protein
MTHAVRTSLLTFCLAVLPAGMVFSFLFLSPLSGLSQALNFSTHSFASANASVALHGDLNNDGYEDLIISVGTRSFGVYLSKGDGNYRALITYTTPGAGFTGPLALADLNHDGKLDLIVEDSNNFFVYVGKGDGTFRAAVNVPVSSMIWTMASADVNHDGNPDVLLSTDDGLQVMFGDGDGSFHAGPTTKNIPITGGLITGDFDGDGIVDVAVVTSPQGTTQFEVFRGAGDGTFNGVYSASSQYVLNSLVAADVNGDGISDLISTGIGNDEFGERRLDLFVYYGHSGGIMEPGQIPLNNYGVGQVAVADFNGDGIPDVALFETDCEEGCNNPFAGALTVVSGEGNGNFGLETTVSGVEINPGTPYAVRGNPDSKADLVFANPTSDSTTIMTLMNQTTGNFPTCSPPNAAVAIAQCSPTTGSTANSPVNFAVGAAADEPIRKIELWADGKKQLEQFAGTFSNYGFLNASVPLTAGSHRINIITAGWDNSQQSKVSTITVKASSCSAPTSAGVHICSPGSGASVSSPVAVAATSKVTGTIVSTQLWVDGVKNFNAPGSTTLTATVSLAAGTHRFAVIATNTSGQKWESAVNATVK